MLLALLAGAGLSVLVALAIEARISAQRDRNEFIQRENRELDGQIREIGQLRQEIESLRARQLAVESLQRERTLPVHLLDDLVRHTPEGVYLRQLRQAERRVGLVGMADPPKAQMRETLATFHRAGIRTVMITGDQSATAHAIAKQIGLRENGTIEILDSTRLEGLPPEGSGWRLERRATEV